MSLTPSDCKSLQCPDGLADIIETFGDPRPYIGRDGLIAPEWELRHITRVKLLEPLPYAGGEVTRITCHVRIAPIVKDIFETIADNGLWPLIRAWGGGYECRAMRGGGDLSTHAWGIAVDLEPAPDWRGVRMMPPAIIRIFRKRGFLWGGDYCRGTDHFQFAAGYGLDWAPLPEIAVGQDAIAV